MTKQKSTKRALLLSALSLLMCVSMLIGSTFAWFTDSVTSGNNKIVAGNLDVALYHTNGTDTDEEVTNTTTLFDEVALWEPGAMVWEKLTVKNLGSLALKYSLKVNITDISKVGDKSLADVLKVAVMNEQPTRENIASNATQSLESFVLGADKALTAGNSDVFYVAIYWAPSANDNDYNVAGEALYANLGVTLMATQYTSEADSFDNQYDKEATYDGTINDGINTEAEIIAALNAGKTEIALTGTVTLTDDLIIPDEEVVTISGGAIDANGKTINVYSANLADTTVKNAVIESNDGSSEFNISGEVVFEGVDAKSGVDFKGVTGSKLAVFNTTSSDNLTGETFRFYNIDNVAVNGGNYYTLLFSNSVATVEGATVNYTVNAIANSTVTIIGGDVEAAKSTDNTGTIRYPSGSVAYRAYVLNSTSRQAVQIDMENIYATKSFVIELWHDDTLLTTTTYLDSFPADRPEYTTACVALVGGFASWDTTIADGVTLTDANVPNSIKVYADGVLTDTFTHDSGSVLGDKLSDYLALDCVGTANN